VQITTRKSKAVDVIFSPVVFVVVFLSCFAFAVINMLYNVLPYPWGMVLFPPLILFGLIGYFIDEIQS
jgi:hypothetical protein